MSQIEQTIEYLERSEAGAYVENKDNGRSVEVACMVGGRYLCKDSDGEPVKQTNSPCAAYYFLTGSPDPVKSRVKIFEIAYLIDKKKFVVKVEGFDKAQSQVAQIMDAGGEVLGIKEVAE